MEHLRTLAEEVTQDIEKLFGTTLPPEQHEALEQIIEQAIIRAMLEGHHKAVDTAFQLSEAEQDEAHKIAEAIRRKNDLLIANLSSLR